MGVISGLKNVLGIDEWHLITVHFDSENRTYVRVNFSNYDADVLEARNMIDTNDGDMIINGIWCHVRKNGEYNSSFTQLWLDDLIEDWYGI